MSFQKKKKPQKSPLHYHQNYFWLVGREHFNGHLHIPCRDNSKDCHLHCFFTWQEHIIIDCGYLFAFRHSSLFWFGCTKRKLPAGSLWLLQIWDSLFNLTFILSSTSLLHFNSPCFILYECWWLQQCLLVCFFKKQMDPKDKKKNWIMRFCKMSFLKSTMENKIATLLLCIYGFTTSQEKQESSRSDVLWHRFWSVWVALERQEIHVCVFKT